MYVSTLIRRYFQSVQTDHQLLSSDIYLEIPVGLLTSASDNFGFVLCEIKKTSFMQLLDLVDSIQLESICSLHFFSDLHFVYGGYSSIPKNVLCFIEDCESNSVNLLTYPCCCQCVDNMEGKEKIRKPRVVQ